MLHHKRPGFTCFDVLVFFFIASLRYTTVISTFKSGKGNFTMLTAQRVMVSVGHTFHVGDRHADAHGKIRIISELGEGKNGQWLWASGDIELPTRQRPEDFLARAGERIFNACGPNVAAAESGNIAYFRTTQIAPQLRRDVA